MAKKCSLLPDKVNRLGRVCKSEQFSLRARCLRACPHVWQPLCEQIGEWAQAGRVYPLTIWSVMSNADEERKPQIELTFRNHTLAHSLLLWAGNLLKLMKEKNYQGIR